MDRFYKMRTLTKATAELMLTLDTKYHGLDSRAKCLAITQCMADILITTLHLPVIETEYGNELLRELRTCVADLHLDDRALLMVLSQELSLMVKNIPEQVTEEINSNRDA